jgi:hypothetical protein
MGRREKKRIGAGRSKKACAGRLRRESGTHRTIVPPTGAPEAAAELRPALSVDLLVEGESAEPGAPASPRASPSGIVSVGPEIAVPSDDELAKFLVSLRPYYRQGERESERAPQLEVEDLSLRPDNPYLASPLLAPPEPSRPVRPTVLRVVALTAFAAVVSGGAWMSWRAALASLHAARPHNAAARAVASAAPSTPVGQAPSVDRRDVAQLDTSTSLGSVSSAPTAMPEALADTTRPEATPIAQSGVPKPVIVTASAPRAQRRTTPGPTTSAPQLAGEQNATPERAPAQAPHPPSKALRSNAPPQTAEPPAPDPSPPVVVPALEPSEPLAPLSRVPTPKAVKMGFEKIHGLLAECAGGKHGLVTIHATIMHDGRISGASVDGVFSTAEERACMARAILTASFPAFSQSSFRISYPLVL